MHQRKKTEISYLKQFEGVSLSIKTKEKSSKDVLPSSRASRVIQLSSSDVDHESTKAYLQLLLITLRI